MEVLITIIEFLAVLGVVVVVHEFGHFATAKAFGIRVNEFGFGFPPKVLTLFRKGETDYTINLIPLGGFVKLEGENDPTSARSLASKGVGTRFIVLVSGVVMNVVLAVVLLSGLFMFTVQDLRIESVSPGSPAEQAGLLPGDVILEANGRQVDTYGDLSEEINPNRGSGMEWLIRRDTEEHRISIVPRLEPPPGEGATGISISTVGYQRARPTRPPWEAIAQGIKITWAVPGLLKEEITNWVAGDGETPFAGPIGIAHGTGEVAREYGLLSLIPLAALFSISLAILNILPIPALDGGRIFFVLLEWVRRGKRIPPEKEGLVHLIGFVVLIVMILGPLTYNDIVRIADGSSLLR